MRKKNSTYSFFINNCFADLLFLPLSWIRNSQIQSKSHFDYLTLSKIRKLFSFSAFIKFWNTDRAFNFMISSVWINSDTRVTTLLHPSIITYCWLIKKIIKLHSGLKTTYVNTNSEFDDVLNIWWYITLQADAEWYW